MDHIKGKRTFVLAETTGRGQTGTMMFGKVAKKREEEFIFLSESSLCVGGAYDTMNVV